MRILKIWIVTVLLTPAFVILLQMIPGVSSHKITRDFFLFYFIVVLMSIVYSTPTVFVMFVADRILGNRYFKPLIVKLVLSFIALSGIFFMFYLFSDSSIGLRLSVLWPIGYSVVMVSSIFLVKKREAQLDDSQ